MASQQNENRAADSPSSTWSEGAKAAVSCWLFVHFFAVVAALWLPPEPSELKQRLAGVLLPYTETLGLVTTDSYHLTYGPIPLESRNDDYFNAANDVYVEVEVLDPGNNDIVTAAYTFPDDETPGLPPRLRRRSLAETLAAAARNNLDQVANPLAQSIAGHVILTHRATKVRVRVWEILSPGMPDFEPRENPRDVRFRRERYRAVVKGDPASGRVDTPVKQELDTGRVAPVQ